MMPLKFSTAPYRPQSSQPAGTATAPRQTARTIATALAAGVLIALPLHEVAAQQVAGLPSSSSVIADTVLSNSTGIAGVNVTSGEGNAQSSAIAIGVSSAGLGGADLITWQQGAPLSAGAGVVGGGSDSVAIRGDAFRGSHGALSVNQSSGSGNVQSSQIALAAGVHAEVSLDQLVQVTATTDQSGAPTAARVRRAEIAGSAFSGARGVVQVSQVAGVANRSANVFALSVSSAVP